MIEQPLMHDNLVDHATFQAQVGTPICLDESITSPDKARKAIQIGACRGSTSSLAVSAESPAPLPSTSVPGNGIPCGSAACWSRPSAAGCLALATLPNIRYPSDIFPTDRFYREDLGEPAMQHSAPGQFCPSMKPGVGVEPNPKALQRMTLEHAVLEGIERESSQRNLGGTP